VAQSGYSHQPLRWHTVRVVQELILALTSEGKPAILPKGMVLFGPVAESGDFATMMQDSKYYKCHVDELLQFTTEVGPARSGAGPVQDKVA
jgi:hypothetical protein